MVVQTNSSSTKYLFIMHKCFDRVYTHQQMRGGRQQAARPSSKFPSMGNFDTLKNIYIKKVRCLCEMPEN